MPRTKSGKPARLASLALAVALAAAFPAGAQLYKWVDAQGKTQYSDRPPKGFTGEVIRIEPDVAPTPMPAPPRVAPAAAKPAASEVPPVPDMNARRKANRERLELRLERARTNLERAKKALTEAPGPDIDERQVIQQRVKTQAGGMHAMAPRSNCKEVVEPNGTKATVCPAVLPAPAYYDRIAALEEGVRRAEEELDAAERAYRQGRD